MTPALTAAETLLSCLAILALHALGYYVFVAVNAPRYVPGHEIDLPPIEAQR